jgi:hypothetical protein
MQMLRGISKREEFGNERRHGRAEPSRALEPADAGPTQGPPSVQNKQWVEARRSAAKNGAGAQNAWCVGAEAVAMRKPWPPSMAG